MEYIYIGLNLDINSHLGWLNKNLPHRKLDLYELDLHADLDIDVPYEEWDVSRTLSWS